MEPRNRFQEINSASLCCLTGRDDNPIPTRFLAPIDCLKILAQSFVNTVGSLGWVVFLVDFRNGWTYNTHTEKQFNCRITIRPKTMLEISAPVWLWTTAAKYFSWPCTKTTKSLVLVYWLNVLCYRVSPLTVLGNTVHVCHLQSLEK